MKNSSPYIKTHRISFKDFGSCDVYYMKPGGVEKNHFHDGIEIAHAIKGNCKTHREGKVYVYQKGQVHEVVNDSKDELVFVCLTIPPESKKNTHYV